MALTRPPAHGQALHPAAARGEAAQLLGGRPTGGLPGRLAARAAALLLVLLTSRRCRRRCLAAGPWLLGAHLGEETPEQAGLGEQLGMGSSAAVADFLGLMV